MDEQNTNPATRAVTGNFQLNAQMPNGKAFSISGYIYDGESKESLDNRVDILHDVLDRQRLRAEIPELEAKRNQMIAQLSQMKDHMLAQDNKVRAGGKLTGQDKAQLEQLRVSLAKVQEDIDKGADAIRTAKAITGIP